MQAQLIRRQSSGSVENGSSGRRFKEVRGSTSPEEHLGVILLYRHIMNYITFIYMYIYVCYIIHIISIYIAISVCVSIISVCVSIISSHCDRRVI